MRDGNRVVFLTLVATTLCVASSMPAIAQTSQKLTVTAYIDGRSALHLRGDTAQWHHTKFIAPGRWNGANFPTILNTQQWFPVWPSTGENSFCDCFSNLLSGVAPALPINAQTLVSLKVIEGRSNVFIAQQPSPSNNYTLIVDFDDEAPAGAAWYSIELTYKCDVQIPVPFSYQKNPLWRDLPLGLGPETIGDRGCALTSLAMLMSSHNYHVTPAQLNATLNTLYADVNGNGQRDRSEASLGFDQNNNLKFEVIGLLTLGRLQYKAIGRTEADLANELCNGRPAILQEPGHFVVATGTTPESYVINNPGFVTGEGELLSDRYNNRFTSVRRFGPPGSGLIAVRTTAPADLLVTDPLGRRLGVQGGVVLEEIPNASYFEESTDTLNLPGTGRVSRVAFIPKPIEGRYNIRVEGTSEPTTVEIDRYDYEENPLEGVLVTLNSAPTFDSELEISYSSKPGDLNSDGAVDAGDIRLVAQAMNSTLGGRRYNPVADVDHSGRVDAADLRYVIANRSRP